MTGRADSQLGFSLVEVLVAMTISLLVMGSLYTAFAGFETTHRRTTNLNDAQDATRTSVDAMVRNLRNATSITRLDGYDIRFNTDRPDFGVAPSSAGYRVRYCLETAQSKLWMQVAPANTADPGSDCPAAGWGTSSRTIATQVVNRRDGRDRPLFPLAAGARSIRVDLWSRAMRSAPGPEVHLESAVFVRSLSQGPGQTGNPPNAPGPSTCSNDATGRPLLTIDQSATRDANGNPVNITVSENGSVIGQGSQVRLTPGAHNLTITLTDVLGVARTVTQPVNCP